MSNWLQQYLGKSLYFMGLVLVTIIIFGYIFNWAWVGVGNYFGPSNMTSQEFERSKTVWDWLEIFIVPVILGVGIWWLNSQQAKTNRDIASEKQNQITMDQYFDRMTELLFTPGIVQSNKDKVNAHVIGRARTLDVLQSLDGKRKGQILQFLKEANLITYKVNEDDTHSLPIIDLKRANLAEVELTGTDLEQAVLENLTLDGARFDNARLEGIKLEGSTLVGASLRNANLGKPFQEDVTSMLNGVSMQGADFTDAVLNYAKLRGCGFEDAILINTKLKGVDLTGANLTGAKLIGAKLEGAILVGANLTGANLQDAIMIGANLTRAKLEGAILDGADLSNATLSFAQLIESQSHNDVILPENLLDDAEEDSEFSISELVLAQLH